MRSQSENVQRLAPGSVRAPGRIRPVAVAMIRESIAYYDNNDRFRQRCLILDGISTTTAS